MRLQSVGHYDRDVHRAIEHIRDGELRLDEKKADWIEIRDPNGRWLRRKGKPHELEAFELERPIKRDETRCEFCDSPVRPSNGRLRSAVHGEPHSATACAEARRALRETASNPGRTPEQRAAAAATLASLKDGCVTDSLVGLDLCTGEEQRAIAEREGFAVADLRQRWFIQHKHGYYVLTSSGYAGPLIRPELGLAIDQHLKRAPVERMAPTRSGERKLRPEEIARTHGFLVKEIYADMTAQRSHLDAAGEIFFEAVCPARKLEPLFDQQIDRWLRLLGGAQAERLLDWCATVTDLAHQTSALLLIGPHGIGKNMLATGLARLWVPGAPTALEDIVGSFNSSLARCPLIFADEAVCVPDSKFLRSLVGSDSRTLRRKHLPDASLRGCPRLVIAANSADVLAFDRETFSEGDTDAIATRFLDIRASAAAAEFLTSLGGRRTTDAWVEGDLIARHVVHLKETRVVTPGPRFLVQGDADEMAKRLATSGTVRGLIIEAAARALAKSPATPGMKWDGILIGAGKFSVNASWLHDSWAALIGQAHRPPTLKTIGATLAGISHGEMRRAMIGGKRTWVYDLKHDLVIERARELGIGDPDAMRERIGSEP